MAGRRDAGAAAIAGVIHGAGIWDDCELASLDEKALGLVLAPKVAGTLTLDAAFPAGELDFFVVFSAFSALLPAERQASYAAANAFADAIVARRRTAGDRAFTVNWGLWAGIGFGATEYGRRAHDRLRASGIGRIGPPDGWALLDRLIAANRSGVGVMPVDWRRLFEVDPNARLSPLLSDLAAEWAGAAGAAEAPGQLAEAVANLPSERQLATIEAALTSIVSGVMRLDRREVAVDAPLTEFGLDSLMAVEIKNRLQHDAGVNLPLVQLLEGPSILDLATRVLASIKISGLASRTPSAGGSLEEIEI
jgi:acyl carrier protein